MADVRDERPDEPTDGDEGDTLAEPPTVAEALMDGLDNITDLGRDNRDEENR